MCPGTSWELLHAGCPGKDGGHAHSLLQRMRQSLQKGFLLNEGKTCSGVGYEIYKTLHQISEGQARTAGLRWDLVPGRVPGTRVSLRNKSRGPRRPQGAQACPHVKAGLSEIPAHRVASVWKIQDARFSLRPVGSPSSP